jgi:Uncharacterised protein family UPF0547
MRVVGTLGALIGLITGIATLVGWIASGDTLSDILSVALPVAGAAFLLVGAVVFARDGLKATGAERWENLVPAAVFTLLFAFGLSDPDALRMGGWLPLGIGVLWALFKLSALFAPSGKQCPDCAETVKADAKVCRFCGWRFEEVPNRTGHGILHR